MPRAPPVTKAAWPASSRLSIPFASIPLVRHHRTRGARRSPMCGIVGWSLSPGRSADPRVLTAMRRTIAHRGPDDEGESVDATAGVALGFQRLAILDLTPASGQPMADAEAGVAMIFNGELYN